MQGLVETMVAAAGMALYLVVGVLKEGLPRNEQMDTWTLAAIKAVPVLGLGILLLMRSQSEAAPDSVKAKSAQSTYMFWVGLGLVFGSFGDVALQLERDHKIMFVAGLVSFLISHVAYITAFIKDSSPAKLCASGSIATFVVVGLYMAGVLQALLPDVMSGHPELTVPVLVYSGAIGLMAVNAILRVPQGVSSGIVTATWTLSVLGSLFFVASDTILAMNKFVPAFNRPRMEVMVTYYIAQLLLSLSAHNRGAAVASKDD